MNKYSKLPFMLNRKFL